MSLRVRPGRFRSALRAALATGATAAMTLVLPGVATAHQLTGRYESPLPLGAYLAGAATAVGLSFAFVLRQPLRSRRAESAPAARAAARSREVPAWLRTLLRAAGLVGWLWIVAQALVGTPGGADVASLFLWVYGWVGLALVSACIGPAWRWIDPFATLHDLGAALLRRLGVGGWPPAPYPVRLATWPATGGFVLFVWLELVMPGTRAGPPLALALLGYTAWTLLMMAQFGRDAWRANGETFSVWFGTLGRLAPLALDPDDERRVRIRRPADGLAEVTWPVATIGLVALATGSILFDGLSQTTIWLDTFGVTDVARGTILLAGFLGLICGVVLVATRLAGRAALGAGLVPIALGYLVAHYLTYLIGDGQRIVVALSDPFGLGWDLLGAAQYEPTLEWLSPGAVWALQIGAVVGGHVVGAWAGHAAAIRSAMAPRAVGETAGTGPVPAVIAERRIRLQQVPLALLMVGLTTLTLWSLGQNVVTEPDEEEAAASRAGQTGVMAWRHAAPAAGSTRIVV